MAIGTRTKPRVIVVGGVTRTREFRRKVDQELLGHNVEIETPGGGVSLTYWLSDGAEIPMVGEYIGVVAGVDEGRDAQLVHISDLTEGDFDQMHSDLFVPVKS